MKITWDWPLNLGRVPIHGQVDIANTGEQDGHGYGHGQGQVRRHRMTCIIVTGREGGGKVARRGREYGCGGLLSQHGACTAVATLHN